MANRRERGGTDSWITIHGARVHNLKNLKVRIPRDSLVVITGVSGSGKSTLAFDLLYAEGQRRFLDSMSAYARQFVQQLPRPDVDRVDGLPPSVSIEQRNSRGGGKSTVGTVTEIHQFVRLLYARLGIQYCPACDQRVEPQTREQLVQRLNRLRRRQGELRVLAPLVRGRKGFHSTLAGWAKSRGYGQLRADGTFYSCDAPFKLDRFREHNVEVVVGKVPANNRSSKSLKATRDLVDEALQVGKGVFYSVGAGGEETIHSTERACPSCQQSFDRLDPKDFSYNSAKGWCPDCRGFGELFYLPQTDRGAREEAIEDSWYRWQEGERECCPSCDGGRLNARSRSVYLEFGKGRTEGEESRGMAIDALGRMTVAEAHLYFKKLRPRGHEKEIVRDILPEIQERLRFLEEVGLGYLQLGRGVTTLSGGENQRIRLAAQLGSNLSGVLYVLDEPTIGLHVRDNHQLLTTLQRLKDKGNSLVVVEHDEDTILQADYLVDLGPAAGVEGGTIVGAAPLNEFLNLRGSVTADCLRQPKCFPLRGKRRPVGRSGSIPSEEDSTAWMELSGASGNNLKNVRAAFPLNRLVVVSGVSGSGKSTLIRQGLLPALRDHTGQSEGRESGPETGRLSMDATFPLGRVYEIDQSPIGRTPRSIPATYVGIFDGIRKVFSQLPESRMRGYGPGRFSFNSSSGRCPECEGAGAIKMEMAFMPSDYVHCEACDGTRYSSQTLMVRYRGKNIGEVLDLSIAEAFEFFGAFPSIRNALRALMETGLGYLRLGQTSPTLSGGEAQRLKLVTHLLGGMRAPGARAASVSKRHVFLLEEPTIGLHILDVHRLLGVLQRLVDQGHSVIVIEHNLDVIAEADWVIDLGPEGGEGGGRIVAQGAPETLSRHRISHTGRYLKRFLQASPRSGGKGGRGRQ